MKLKNAMIGMILTQLVGCGGETSHVESSKLTELDSATSEAVEYYAIAYQETADEEIVVDQIIPGVDTIIVVNRLELSKDYGPPEVPFWVYPGSMLRVQKCDSIICEVRVYDAKGEDLGTAYLPRIETSRLLNVNIDLQKIRFYDALTRRVYMNGERLKKKYNLSDREFDSLFYGRIEKMRSKLPQ